MLNKAYNHKEIEEKWKNYWEKNKIYKFDPNSKKPVYSIDTPPPTVSGQMHMGHAFSYIQQDVIVRYKRMKGYNIFYPFGTDDNGLATERLVESINNVRGKDMNRDDFINLCIKTLEKIRPKYIQDWKNIALSADFDIFYSTIDKHSRKISQRSFIELYKNGREYRKKSPVIWCPECHTAIAQVEMEDRELTSTFNDIIFKVDGKDLVISTTRPELLSSCVAIFYNPIDKRYKNLKGKKAKVPLFNYEVPILEDEKADPQKGTGIVMCCTFGDQTDVEWYKKHNLPLRVSFAKHGTMTKTAEKYEGLTIKQAREKIIEDLKKQNLLKKQEKIKHTVNVHERCGTEIEILESEQWFIKYLDLKTKFLEAGNKLNWYPKHMKNRYDNWIKGLQWDWCISRQRFFGVPFPVWYCKKCNEVKLAEIEDLPVDPLYEKPKTKCKCGSNEFIPEKDILDTWATSSLTPRLAIELFKDKKIFKKLFPMSLRPQAHDIITFWLFNTVVKSQLHYTKNPWKDVVISGWALDPNGKKMSKSKGNVIEPQEKLETYGADVLRFWASGSKLGEDLPFQEKDLVTGKRFAIKLWNASKFTLTHLKDYKPTKPKKLEDFDKFLLSKLQRLVDNSTKSFDKYEYSRNKLDTENFFWNTFCDYYLEIVKDRLYNKKRTKQEKDSAKYTLYIILLTNLKLLAPIMPYITEEIYYTYFIKQEKAKSIHVSIWPKSDKKLINQKIEKSGNKAIEIISKVRKFKAQKQISLKKEITLTLDKKDEKDLKPFIKDLQAVVNAKEIKYGKFSISL